jgi:PIN domain nuclease of toxin-antitoxin system
LIVLDTHALIWYLDSPQKISSTGRSTIEAGFNGEGVGISDITLWEVAMLVANSRLVFDRDVGAWLGGLRALPNFQVVPISPAIAALSARLPGDFHADPADRLITSTAIDRGAPLVTKDERIRRYPHVDTVW